MDTAIKICLDCQHAPVEALRPGKPPHANSRYCAACRTTRRQHPPSNITEAQATQIEALRGQITRQAIAKKLGVSQAAVNRYLREHALHSNSQKYAPEIVDAVILVYEAGGKHAVREQFPEVNVRSIVERYDHAPRQIRWTDAQIIEAAQMAGLVGPENQARYFGRPNAYNGSIVALWHKVFQCAPGDINGLGSHLAWTLTTPGVPAVLVRQEVAPGPKTKVLWIDLAEHLRPDIDPTVKDVIEVLAQFQRWLHGVETTEPIRTMIQEREIHNGELCNTSQDAQQRA